MCGSAVAGRNRRGPFCDAETRSRGPDGSPIRCQGAVMGPITGADQRRLQELAPAPAFRNSQADMSHSPAKKTVIGPVKPKPAVSAITATRT